MSGDKQGASFGTGSRPSDHAPSGHGRSGFDPLRKEGPPEAVRYPVFRDNKGNRFIFPSVYSYEDQSVSWGYCRTICATLNVEEEKDTFNVVPDAEGMLNFSRVVAQAGSRGFMHGSSEVWLIGGPEFEAVAKSGAKQ